MTITSTKSWKHYMLICHILSSNDIPFIRNDTALSIRCSISSRDGDMLFFFSVDPSKMLINLYSPLNFRIKEEDRGEIALGLCMINNKLSHGCFYLDTEDNIIYFRMTTSFYETNLNEMLFEYMLSSAADSVEEFSDVIKKLTGETPSP